MVKWGWMRVVAALAATTWGCLGADLDEDPLSEVGFAESELTKTDGGINGQEPDFCDDPANPCLAGEGDCDSDTHCAGTLGCVADVGARFGMHPNYDVCLPAHCESGVLDGDETGVDVGGSCGAAATNPNAPGTADYCTATFPCSSGDGDCDRDGDCAGPLVCVADIGPRFGMPVGYDVCANGHCEDGVLSGDETSVDAGGSCGDLAPNPETPGSTNYCTDLHPCSSGNGDCDVDTDCRNGLACVDDVGGRFGMPASYDVCLAAHCDNGVQDGDETSVDTGGACGDAVTNPNAPGTVSYCSPAFPCSHGNGDCDSNADCRAGLSCVEDVGPAYGMRAGYDVCVDPNVCNPGEYSVAGGCEPCPAETYSDTFDAPSCTPWTVCGAGETEQTPGTSTSDRLCAAGEWVRQFGTNGSDQGEAMAVDASGNVYVAGFTTGTLPGQTSAGAADVFLRKYDAAGTVIWTRQFGSSAADEGRAVAVDGSGNVYIAGYTEGTLPGQTSAGASDIFLRKYSGAGAVLWTRQLGSDDDEYGQGVSVDRSGNVAVTGYTFGTFPGQTAAGGVDAVVRRYNGAGTALWTRQFGTSGDDVAVAVSSDRSANVIVAGSTNGTFSGLTSAGGADIFVRKLDSAGATMWTRQGGSSDSDFVEATSVDGSGNILVAGQTEGAFPGQTNRGRRDVFVRKYNGAGTEQWTRQLGTPGTDVGAAVTADASGNVYVAGSGGTFPGSVSAGGRDAFVRKYGATGTEQWTRQFGSSGNDHGRAVGVNGTGDVHVAGYTTGTLPEQTSAGGNDAFVVRVLP